jgi:hypothetical protein
MDFLDAGGLHKTHLLVEKYLSAQGLSANRLEAFASAPDYVPPESRQDWSQLTEKLEQNRQNTSLKQPNLGRGSLTPKLLKFIIN